MRSRLRGMGAPLLAVGDVARELPRPPGWTGVAAVVAFLLWPTNVVPPGLSDNIDISWITALHVAAHEGLRFGGDFNFVYGPLGYLTFGNLFYDDTGLMADVVSGLIFVSAVALVARAACNSLGLFVGGVLTFVVIRIAVWPIDRVEYLPAILVAVTAIALHRANGPLPARQGAAIGVLAAFCELAKFSGGTFALTVAVVLAAIPLLEPGRPWRVRLALAWPPLAGAAGGLLALWLLAGETLWDIGPYLRNAVDFVSGNVDAVATTAPGLGYQYVYAVVAIVALAAALALDGRGMRPVPRLAIAAVWLLFVYVSFRHGFTRHTPGHVQVFFGPVLLASAAVFLVTSTRTVALLACIPLIVPIWAIGKLDVAGIASASTSPAVTQIDYLLSPAKRHELQARVRAMLRDSYHLPPRIVNRLRGETVHIDPHEAAVAWAFPEFVWRPAPVFQSYSAYTTHLDELNAEFLAGERAPRYVLRENVALDARNGRFESPAYMLELICRYREVTTTARWQLLERGPTRCGRPRPAGSQRVHFGERVVPPPSLGGVMAARFESFDVPIGDRLRRALLKRRTQWIVLGPGIMNRFVPGHAASPHVLTVPPCLGWSGALFDARSYQQVAIGWLPGVDRNQVQDPSYTVSFERVPFDCDAPATRRGTGG